MSSVGSRALTTLTGWFFLSLSVVLQLAVAAGSALVLVLLYFWAFPRGSRAWAAARDESIVSTIEDFGYGWYALLVAACFGITLMARRSKDRDKTARRRARESDQAAELGSRFGDSARTEAAGAGYVTKVTINGKEFEGGHQMFGIRGRHATVNTASTYVRFPINDTALEIGIVQPRFWITPKKEPFSLGLTRDSDPLSILMQRYDCTFSDRGVLAAFIADEDVRRELLPKFPNSYERSSLIIKNGEVRLECTADTKPDTDAAEAATFALSKKLFARAAIFERQLREIGHG